MCGYVAVFQTNVPVDETRLNDALRTIIHRGPDHQAYRTASVEVAATAGVRPVFAGLAHARLSIIDPDPRANQPYGYDPDQLLVYNGEIYNHRELRRTLRDSIAFETESDTELMHACLVKDGEMDFTHVDGMWSFAFWDAKRARVVLSRDRYGKKPLFYYLDKDRVIVASEAKAIFSYLGQRFAFQMDDIVSYLRYGFLFPKANEKTAFQNIRQLAPGETAVFDLATWSMRSRRYFDPNALAASDAPSTKDELAGQLHRAVTSRLVSDRPVGLLLSGGIDSTLILSVLKSAGALDQVTCFIGDAGATDDARFAREAAEEVGAGVRELPLDYARDAFDGFLTMCRQMEKPFPILGNTMAMRQMYEAVAATDVKVVIDGSGGDEVFGGYWDRYLPLALETARARGDDTWIAAIRDANAGLPPATRAFNAFDAGNALAVLAGSTPQPVLLKYCSERVIEARSSDLLAQETNFIRGLITDAFSGRLGDWIWQNDRNAMTFGLENRSPFLSAHLLSQFAVDYDRKFNGVWNKHELRSIFNRFAPVSAQWRRQKQGFKWLGPNFLGNNRDRIFELVAASTLLPDLVDVDSVLNDMADGGLKLANHLTPRLICVAGLERALAC
ncbi:MAG: asparagine synthase (glutamine-hydrolyzing) [Pseudomonadota bacterium]